MATPKYIRGDIYKQIAKEQRLETEKVRNVVMSLALYGGLNYKEAQRAVDAVQKNGLQYLKPR